MLRVSSLCRGLKRVNFVLRRGIVDRSRVRGSSEQAPFTHRVVLVGPVTAPWRAKTQLTATAQVMDPTLVTGNDAWLEMGTIRFVNN